MNIWEFEELARHLCGIHVTDETEADIDDLLFDKFEVDFPQFCKIAEALLPLAILAGPGTGSMADEVRQGFGVDGYFLVKQKVTDEALIGLAGGG